VPTDRDTQIAWLYERWQVVDDWVGEHRAESSVPQPAPTDEPVPAI
jgi:hypothetical protein